MKNYLDNILFFAMIFAMICVFMGYVFLLVWLVGEKDDSIIYPIIAILAYCSFIIWYIKVNFKQ